MRNSSAAKLAMRDPARAALFGAIGGASFGAERGRAASFGSDPFFGADFGNVVDPFAGDDDPFGDDADFGDDDMFGADFGAAARPTPAAMARTYVAAKKKAAKTAKRKSLLEPNAGSAQKIERYSFAISTPIVLGTPSSFAINGSPDVAVRPQRLVVNAPAPGFVTFSSIRVANVTVTVGPGTVDGFSYNPLAVGTILDLPTLSPQNRATFTGNYTGFTPPGYIGGSAYTLSFEFIGWAEIVA